MNTGPASQPTSRVPGQSGRALLTALFAVILGAGSVLAHPLAPALLELREAAPRQVEVRWKTATLRAPGVELAPVLPPHCAALTEPTATVTADSVTTSWAVDCGAASLVGQQIGVDGLGAAKIDALVRVTLSDGRVIRGVVRAAEPFLTVPERERPADVVRAYIPIGIEHILSGLDHLLFVAGLLLLVRGRRLLIETITAFTVGHSITLSLAVLDLVRVPSRPLELLIALSVFLLAVELTRAPRERPTLMRRRPWLMALVFGLLHGLGFASALREVGLPTADVPLALFAFNLGIEIGQLAFVAACLAAAAALRTLRSTWPRWAVELPLYAMGSLAAFWCFERAADLMR